MSKRSRRVLKQLRAHSQTKSRKGVKLQGLSTQEAHTRSLKGWKTKHQRYRYHQATLRRPQNFRAAEDKEPKNWVNEYGASIPDDESGVEANLRPRRRQDTVEESFGEAEGFSHLSVNKGTDTERVAQSVDEHREALREASEHMARQGSLEDFGSGKAASDAVTRQKYILKDLGLDGDALEKALAEASPQQQAGFVQRIRSAIEQRQRIADAQWNADKEVGRATFPDTDVADDRSFLLKPQSPGAPPRVFKKGQSRRADPGTELVNSLNEIIDQPVRVSTDQDPKQVEISVRRTVDRYLDFTDPHGRHLQLEESNYKIIPKKDDDGNIMKDSEGNTLTEKILSEDPGRVTSGESKGGRQAQRHFPDRGESFVTTSIPTMRDIIISESGPRSTLPEVETAQKELQTLTEQYKKLNPEDRTPELKRQMKEAISKVKRSQPERHINVPLEKELTEHDLVKLSKAVAIARTDPDRRRRALASAEAKRIANTLGTKFGSAYAEREQMAALEDITSSVNKDIKRILKDKEELIPAVVDPRSRFTAEDLMEFKEQKLAHDLSEATNPLQRAFIKTKDALGIQEWKDEDTQKVVERKWRPAQSISNRINAARSGNTQIFLDKQGNPVGIGSRGNRNPMEKAYFGVLPNKKLIFTLNPEHKKHQRLGQSGQEHWYETALTGNRTREIMPWDNSEKPFEQGLRELTGPRTGRLKPGQQDEVIGIDDSQRIHSIGTHVLPGRRVAETRSNDPQVAKEVWIERADITSPRTERLAGRSEEGKQIYFVRKKDNRHDAVADIHEPEYTWEKVDKEEYMNADDGLSEKDDKSSRGERFPNRMTETIRKDILIHHVPIGTVNLDAKEKDQIRLALPGLKVKGHDVLGEHIVFGSIDDDSDSKLAQAARYGLIEPRRYRALRKQMVVERALEHSRETIKNKATFPSPIGPTGEAMPEGLDTALANMQQLGRATKIDYNTAQTMKNSPALQKRFKEEGRGRHGWSEEEADSHLKEFLAAGTAALFYKTRDRAVKGLPRSVENAFEKHAPAKLNKFLDEKNVWSDVVQKPWIESVYGDIRTGTDAAVAIINPFTSQSKGRAPRGGEKRGIIPASIYYRQRHLSDEKKVVRDFERQVALLERSNAAVESAAKWGVKPGVRGRFMRTRKEPLLRWHADILKQTEHPDGPAGHIIDKANTIIQGHYDGKKEVEVYNLQTKLKEPMEISLPVVMKARVARAHAHRELARHKIAHAALQHVNHGPTPLLFPRANRWTKGDFTGNEKGVLAITAVAGTALGAAYLYHRHKQKKLVESGEQLREASFFNRVLPAPFKSPVPSVSWTPTRVLKIGRSEFTDFAQIAGNEIPLSGRVGFTHKTIALRPKDRLDVSGEPLMHGPIGLPRVHFRNPDGGKSNNPFLVDVDQATATAAGKKAFTRAGGKIIIRGKQLPINLEVGKSKPVKLSRTNPNRLTDAEREDLVAAMHSGNKYLSDEEKQGLKNFYTYGRKDKIIDMLNDPKEVERIKIKKGVKEVAGANNVHGKHTYSYVEEAPDAPWNFSPNRLDVMEAPSGSRIMRRPQYIDAQVMDAVKGPPPDATHWRETDADRKRGKMHPETNPEEIAFLRGALQNTSPRSINTEDVPKIPFRPAGGSYNENNPRPPYRRRTF